MKPLQCQSEAAVFWQDGTPAVESVVDALLARIATCGNPGDGASDLDEPSPAVETPTLALATYRRDQAHPRSGRRGRRGYPSGGEACVPAARGVTGSAALSARTFPLLTRLGGPPMPRLGLREIARELCGILVPAEASDHRRARGGALRRDNRRQDRQQGARRSRVPRERPALRRRPQVDARDHHQRGPRAGEQAQGARERGAAAVWQVARRLQVRSRVPRA